MNLRFVEAFYWVVMLKSVTRAAEKMCLTQSAMSSRIAALEDELGMPLLDRRDKQFRLTVAGMRFMGYAQKLLELQREIKGGMGSTHQAQTFSLCLGAIESVLHSWLMPMLEHLRASFPAVELQLSVEATPVLLDLARRGALDLVFAAMPAEGNGLRSRALPPMEMVFVGNGDIHRKSIYRLQDIAEMELITFQQGSQPHVALLDMFRQANLEPHRVHTISSISAITQLVESGLGIATLPRSAALGLRANRKLKLLRTDASLKPLPVYASYRLDPTSAMLEAVVKAALAYIDQREGADSARRLRLPKSAA